MRCRSNRVCTSRRCVRLIRSDAVRSAVAVGRSFPVSEIFPAHLELSLSRRHYPVAKSFSYARNRDSPVLNSKGARRNTVNDTEDRDSQPAETDERLMAAFARGSNDAFSALFGRYKSQIFGFFCRRMEDRASSRSQRGPANRRPKSGHGHQRQMLHGGPLAFRRERFRTLQVRPE